MRGRLPQDGLHGHIVVVAAVAAQHQRGPAQRCGAHGRKGGLHKRLQVVGLRKHGNTLAQAAGAGLLILEAGVLNDGNPH